MNLIFVIINVLLGLTSLMALIFWNWVTQYSASTEDLSSQVWLYGGLIAFFSLFFTSPYLATKRDISVKNLVLSVSALLLAPVIALVSSLLSAAVK